MTLTLPQSLFSGQEPKCPQQVVGSWEESPGLEASATETGPSAKGGQGPWWVCWVTEQCVAGEVGEPCPAALAGASLLLQLRVSLAHPAPNPGTRGCRFQASSQIIWPWSPESFISLFRSKRPTSLKELLFVFITRPREARKPGADGFSRWYFVARAQHLEAQVDNEWQVLSRGKEYGDHSSISTHVYEHGREATPQLSAW